MFPFSLRGSVPASISVSTRNAVEDVADRLESALAEFKPKAVRRTPTGVEFETGLRFVLGDQLMGISSGDLVVDDTSAPVMVRFTIRPTQLLVVWLVFAALLVGEGLRGPEPPRMGIGGGLVLWAIGGLVLASGRRVRFRRFIAGAVSGEQ